MERELSIYLLKLRQLNPFFSTLSLFTEYVFDSTEALFTSKARGVVINPVYFNQLPADEKCGLLLHVTLHTALQHGQRMGMRNKVIWNIASDIVVNNIIIDAESFTPPSKTAIARQYRDQSVEQVYERLVTLKEQSIASAHNSKNGLKGIPTGTQQSANGKTLAEQLYPLHQDLQTVPDKQSSSASNHIEANVKQYWQSAFRKADITAKIGGQQQGKIPAGLKREIDELLNPILDWRLILWNYIVRTPVDFEGYDRRHIHRGLYIDELKSDSLNIVVAIDTSGSIDGQELAAFVSELKSIHDAYHFIQIELYYIDADIYGPFPFESLEKTIPIGGGGTDFAIFFDSVIASYSPGSLDLVVYFTDGFGEFPKQEPSLETLWIVTQGGLQSEKFPFGKVARLAS